MADRKHPLQPVLREPVELKLSVKEASSDKRLIALIQMLARRAARKAYREMLEERSTDGS